MREGSRFRQPSVRMAEAAHRCMAALDAKKQDISMLFLLSRTAWLERFQAGQALIEWVREEAKLRIGEVTAPEFQEEVRREFKRRGIVPVAPERYVYATTKQEVRDRCLQARWPAPFFPVMLQTRPKGAVGFVKRKEVWRQEESGVFILFSCWPDALHALIAMAGTKTFKGYAADFVFENQVVDFGPKQLKFPCRIILDCDAKLADFNNEYDMEELQQSINLVAPWFVKQLVQIGAIRSTDEVVCYQKNKSRPGKASAHLIFGIMGISTDDIREVLDRILIAPWRQEQEREKAQAEKAAKQGEGAPKRKRQKLGPKKLPEPWKVTDRSTMHGRNQFSTLFFKNPDKDEKEFPSIGYKLIIVNGEVKQRLRLSFTRAEFCPENPKALSLLRCCCYSCFMPGFVTLSPDFMVERVVRALFFFATAVRVELTHTPHGGSLKNWVGDGPVLDQARQGLPPSRRASCQRGWSQLSTGSLVGKDTLSTQACHASTKYTSSWCSLSLGLSVRGLPTSTARSSAPITWMNPKSTRQTESLLWLMGMSCMLNALTSRVATSIKPPRRLEMQQRSSLEQRDTAAPGSSSRRKHTARWRGG